MKDEIIELGISRVRRTDHEGFGASLLQLVDRLLRFLGEALLPANAASSPQFRDELEKLRDKILKAEDRASIEEASRSLLSLCESQAKQSRGYLSDRERAYTDLIQLLRNALAEVADQSTEYNNRLLGTSERIGRLVEVQDITVLRAQIAGEVEVLKNGIVEKKRQDELMKAKLSNEIELLRTRLEQAKEEAALDPLTQVANRRSFDHALQRWIQERGGAAGGPFVLAMLDIDDFKRINDTHGHPIGDRVLLCAAQMIGKCIRAADFLARYGGEEFAVLMRDARLWQAETRLSTMLETIARSSFEYQNRKGQAPVQFTLSCGIAEFTPGDAPADLISRADEALYEAKKRGKNQLRIRKKSFLSSMLDRRKSTAD